MRARTRARDRDESGLAAVEAAIAALAIVVLLMLVVFAGRSGELSHGVQTAAAAAARAASLAGSDAGARSAAQQAAAANLDNEGVNCASMGTQTDTTDFAAGGSVTVTLSCSADFSSLAPIAPPGRRVFTATVTEPVDRFRGEDE